MGSSKRRSNIGQSSPTVAALRNMHAGKAFSPLFQNENNGITLPVNKGQKQTQNKERMYHVTESIQSGETPVSLGTASQAGPAFPHSDFTAQSSA